MSWILPGVAVLISASALMLGVLGQRKSADAVDVHDLRGLVADLRTEHDACRRDIATMKIEVAACETERKRLAERELDLLQRLFQKGQS